MPIGVERELTAEPDNVDRADLPQAIVLRQALFTDDGAPETVGIVYRLLSNFRFRVGAALFTAVTRTETISGTEQNPTSINHELVLADGPGKPHQFAVISQVITESDGNKVEDQIVILVNGGN
jgi:hypothetical protein